MFLSIEIRLFLACHHRNRQSVLLNQKPLVIINMCAAVQRIPQHRYRKHNIPVAIHIKGAPLICVFLIVNDRLDQVRVHVLCNQWIPHLCIQLRATELSDLTTVHAQDLKLKHKDTNQHHCKSNVSFRIFHNFLVLISFSSEVSDP